MPGKGEAYRRCAATVLLRPVSGGSAHQVLLVHKPRKRDAWQLPQGGAEEGESVEQAAMRELFEETGIRARVIGRSETRYQYDFPKSYRRFRPDNICGQCIEFVFAQADAGFSVSVDGTEIDSYVWVLPKELPRYIRRREYRRIVEGLVGEGVALLQGA